MSNVTERFLRYVQIDTQSEPDRDYVPSTEKQKVLGELLVQELRELGVASCRMDAHGTVYAAIPASPGCESAPKLGLIAHMDTTPALTGTNVNPLIHRQYAGGDIPLNAELGIVLSEAENPWLADCRGLDLITTDGTTLLGADDKAGVAEIMTAVERLLVPDGPRHGELRIAFTPDEEVGHGVTEFNLDEFGADFGFTVDGGPVGELSFENFNAAALKLEIQGRSIHPGTAKGKMRNALELLMEFHGMLPVCERPEYTEEREGFYHLDQVAGGVDHAEAIYIIRDHDLAKFEQKKEHVRRVCAFLNEKYGDGSFTPELADSYYNMKEKILPEYAHLIENAKAAYRDAGVTPFIVPTRGGTDGAMLSWRGFPCPNLGTGGYNFHGRYECIPIQSMEQTVEMLLHLIRRYAEAAE